MWWRNCYERHWRWGGCVWTLVHEGCAKDKKWRWHRIVSIYRPLGYEPSALPPRHAACTLSIKNLTRVCQSITQEDDEMSIDGKKTTTAICRDSSWLIATHIAHLHSWAKRNNMKVDSILSCSLKYLEWMNSAMMNKIEITIGLRVSPFLASTVNLLYIYLWEFSSLSFNTVSSIPFRLLRLFFCQHRVKVWEENVLLLNHSLPFLYL